MNSRFGLRAIRVVLALASVHVLLFVLAPVPSTAQTVTSGWSTFGGNAQHTGVSQTAAQSLKITHWFTPVDEAPPTDGIPIH